MGRRLTRPFFTRVTSDRGGSGLSPVGVLGWCCRHEPGSGTLMPAENSRAGQQGHVGSHSGKLQLPSWSPVPPPLKGGWSSGERPPSTTPSTYKVLGTGGICRGRPAGAGPPWTRGSGESPPTRLLCWVTWASADPARLAWLWGAAVCYTCPPTLGGPRGLAQPRVGRANTCVCQPLSREVGTW